MRWYNTNLFNNQYDVWIPPPCYWVLTNFDLCSCYQMLNWFLDDSKCHLETGANTYGLSFRTKHTVTLEKYTTFLQIKKICFTTIVKHLITMIIMIVGTIFLWVWGKNKVSLFWILRHKSIFSNKSADYLVYKFSHDTFYGPNTAFESRISWIIATKNLHKCLCSVQNHHWESLMVLR